MMVHRTLLLTGSLALLLMIAGCEGVAPPSGAPSGSEIRSKPNPGDPVYCDVEGLAEALETCGLVGRQTSWGKNLNQSIFEKADSHGYVPAVLFEMKTYQRLYRLSSEERQCLKTKFCRKDLE